MALSGLGFLRRRMFVKIENTIEEKEKEGHVKKEGKIDGMNVIGKQMTDGKNK